MFNKLVDVLRQVFWLKPVKKKPARKTSAKSKKPVKKPKPIKKAAPKPKPPKELKKPLKPVSAPKKELPKLRKVKEPDIDPNLVQVGEITHYFERIKVCVVKITHGSIIIGDRLNILGNHTKIQQKVWSMQIESLDVKVAKKGQLVGLKVDKSVEVGDKVYK